MKKKLNLKLIILISLAFIFRLLLCIFTKGFSTDIYSFTDWADCIARESGVANFYAESGSDYTPGYIYVLWMIGELRKLVDFNALPYTLTLTIMKMPAIICDIISGCVIHRLAKDKFKNNKALIFSALYLFNPAIFLNSAIWGQIDSILGLFMLLCIYWFYKEKMFLSYLSFCIGIIIKPQMGFIAPIILLAIIDHVFIEKCTLKKVLKNISSGIVALIISFLIILPFGINEVLTQYTETVGSFKYGSVNAYNLWSMLGLNWESQDTLILGVPVFVFGYAFIILVYGLTFTLWLNLVLNKINRKHFYFFLGAFSIIGIFTLSVRMHERYMFPSIILLLAFCILANDIKSKILYAIMSIIHFTNVFHIYTGFDPLNYDWNNSEAKIFGAIMVLCFIYMLVVWVQYLIKPNENRKITKSK